MAAPVPDPMLKALFNAIRTDVLEIHEDFDMVLLGRYVLLPTKRSVDELWGLLFKGFVGAPHTKPVTYVPRPDSMLTNLGEELTELSADVFSWVAPAPSPQEALVRAVRKQLCQRAPELERLLVKYAIFKVALYGHLDQSESETLKAIFSKRLVHMSYLTEIGEVVRELTLVKDCSGLFAVCVATCENQTVWRLLTELIKHAPRIITAIVEAYVKGNAGRYVEVPPKLFEILDLKCQYFLATTFADLKSHYPIIPYFDFYIWSRFSKFPSNRVRAQCVRKGSCRMYERDKALKVKGRSRAKVIPFYPHAVHKEVWLEILSRVDLVSLVCTLNMVCKLWRSWHRDILEASPAFWKAFAVNLTDPSKLAQILDLKSPLWNHLLSPRLTALRCLLLFWKDPKFKDDKGIRENIAEAWGHYGSNAGSNEQSMSPESYLDLYVQCSKATGRKLTFYQPSGMPDETYAALMRELIEQHDVMPCVSMSSLEWGCRRLVQVLTNNSSLVGPILQDCDDCLDRLVVYLFSTKLDISPEIDAVLGERSALYRLLFNGDGSGDVETHLYTLLWNYIEKPSLELEPSDVIEMCILLGSQSDPKILHVLKKAINSNYYRVKFVQQYDLDPAETLCAAMIGHLYTNRKNYDEKEIDTVERVLMQCGLWNGRIKQEAFMSCISAFMSRCGPTIKLADCRHWLKGSTGIQAG